MARNRDRARAARARRKAERDVIAGDRALDMLGELLEEAWAELGLLDPAELVDLDALDERTLEVTFGGMSREEVAQSSAEIREQLTAQRREITRNQPEILEAAIDSVLDRRRAALPA